MTFTEPRFRPLIGLLKDHFRQEHYSDGTVWNYPVAVRRFLRALERRGLTVETVTAADVDLHLDSLRLRRYRGPFPNHSRRMHRAAIQMLLRLVRGNWPGLRYAKPSQVEAYASRLLPLPCLTGRQARGPGRAIR